MGQGDQIRGHQGGLRKHPAKAPKLTIPPGILAIVKNIANAKHLIGDDRFGSKPVILRTSKCFPLHPNNRPPFEPIRASG
jgi:hypothetical protein